MNDSKKEEAKNDIAWQHLDQGKRQFEEEKYEDALYNFKKCLILAEDNDNEAELLANFFIGETLYTVGLDLERARAHLVDF